MKLINLLSAINESVELSSSTELKEALKLIICAQDLTNAEIDTITAAYKIGPLYDGDVPSKSARDNLVNSGFIAKITVDKQEGFNACTYKGARLYKLIEEIEKP